MSSRSHPTRLVSLTLSGLVYLGLLGCSGGEKLNTVSGKVFFRDQPLAGALVTFHPKAAMNDVKVERPTGLTKEDGTFTITTGQKEGAAPGEYVVTIICSEVPKADGSKKGKSFGTGDIDTVDRLQGAYANMAASKIVVVIKAGNNELEPFNLK